MPRVSIVMPVYNGEKYLSEAIESILNQSFSDYEFIIVSEFGSNEKANAILQKYAQLDCRIKIIQNPKKMGISASLNIGIENCIGEYIARMDGDDISSPQRLLMQVEYMDNHPEIGLSGIKPTIFGEESWEWKAEDNPDQIKADALFFIPVLHPTAIFRRSLFEKYNLRYNPDYASSEDYDLFTRASRYFPIGNILDPSLFKYRRYATAATYKNKSESDKICKELLRDNLRLLSVELSEDELSLLYLHTGLYGVKGSVLKEQLIHLDLLLKQIFQANLRTGMYKSENLWKTLHKRWIHAYDVIRYTTYKREIFVEEQIKSTWEKSIFVNEEIFLPFQGDISTAPKVSVILPLFNGQDYIYEAIFSILSQTYHNWELLIVMDPSTDDSAIIVEEFSKYNSRIILYKNSQRLGLAGSLNRAVDLSKGEYIGRLDADDIALPRRLEKEVDFLDSHPDIALVSSWQHHFGERDWIHKPPEKHEHIKAALLFKCEVCHSTVMFRKKEFVSQNLRYDQRFLSEDYELWTRAIHQLKFSTIQEVLGEYRWNGNNVTSQKIQAIDTEARTLVASTLRKQLSIEVPEKDMILLSGWTNPFIDYLRNDLPELRKRHEQLLSRILDQNKVFHSYDQDALREVISNRLAWANKDENIYTEQIEGHRKFQGMRRKIKFLLKNIAKRILSPATRFFRFVFKT